MMFFVYSAKVWMVFDSSFWLFVCNFAGNLSRNERDTP